MVKPLYFDYAASCPMHPEVLGKIQYALENNYGNAGSEMHFYGWEAEESVKVARKVIQDYFGVDSSQVIFTSGATEANNLGILGYLKNFSQPGHLITSPIEHKAVLEIFYYLEKIGWEITYLPVDSQGGLDLVDLEKSIRSDTRLISIMWVNNELGTIYPIQAIGQICRKYAIPFHSDFTQGIGKLKIDFPLPDLISFSGHKIYGPKGIGCLIRSKSLVISNLQFGGGQEFGLRPGTLPHPLIIGLGESIRLIPEFLKKEHEYRRWNLRIQTILEDEFGDRLVINQKNGIAQILHFTIRNIDWEQMFLRLNRIAISNGSACHIKSKEPSHVALAIGHKESDAFSSIRISFGYFTEEKDIDFLLEYLPQQLKTMLNERMD